MELKPKLFRITTVASTMNVILKGQLAFLNDHFDVIAITCPDSKHFNEVAEREGVHVFPVKMTRNVSLLNDLISLIKIFTILRKEKPAIVHSQTPKAGLLVMIASKLAGVPVRMHSVVGVPMYVKTQGFKKAILKLSERLTYHFATAVYPNSHGIKSFILSNHLCRASKIGMVGEGSSNGIDTTYFSSDHFDNQSRIKLRKELSINIDSLVFCFVGRIVKDKGIKELVEAFLHLLGSTKNKELTLLIVGPYFIGDDPISEETFNLIRNHKSIRYVGSQRDIRPYLSISDIFTFPSYREGLPNVVLQACAMSLPVIATDIIGSNEIIINEVNGIVIQPKDPVALHDAMKRFCDFPELIQKYRNESCMLISKRYEQKRYWLNLKEEYERQIQLIYAK